MIGSLIFLDIFFLSHHLLETTLTLISSLFAGDFDDFIFLFQELNDEFIFYHLNFLLEWYIYWICYYCWIFWWLNENEIMRWISNVHFKKLKNWEIWLWKDTVIFEILVDFIIIIKIFHRNIDFSIFVNCTSYIINSFLYQLITWKLCLKRYHSSNIKSLKYF